MAVIVAVLAVITIGNVILTMAVLRRLAAHERKLGALAPILGAQSGLSPGEALPAFVVETAAGERVDESHLLPGPSVVAFFSAQCSSCLEHAPEFAALQARHGAPALAVLTGEGDAAAPLIDALGAVPVVREPDPGGALAAAFRVDAYPTYFAVDRGVVVATAGSAGELGGLLALTRS